MRAASVALGPSAATRGAGTHLEDFTPYFFSMDTFPFIIEQYQKERSASGAFQPASRLVMTAALRTSGLLRVLPPDELRDLVLLLTFITPNGRIQPTLPEFAEAMQLSQMQARSRMLRLTRREWRGKPLVRELIRQNGLDAYLPGRHLVDSQEEAHEALSAVPPVVFTEPRAGRETLIAASRARYATPRAEVEADIARRMGWAPPLFEDEEPGVAEEKGQLYEKLSEQGLPKDKALDILSRFDLARVRSQMEWMPHRGAKNPARYLVAAIENNYDPPVAVRADQAEREGGAKL